jgi:hypothetical protein
MSGQGEKSKLRIHEFRHRGNTYQVYLEGLDGQLFATVYAPNGLKRPLVPFPDEIPSGLSPPAIRMGYIAVAEWLVKNDKWPDAETRAALLRASDLEQAA